MEARFMATSLIQNTVAIRTSASQALCSPVCQKSHLHPPRGHGLTPSSEPGVGMFDNTAQHQTQDQRLTAAKEVKSTIKIK